MTTSEKSTALELSNKQVKYLRGKGHSLSPLVLIGKEGINENVLEAVDAELTHHELIKVKIGSNSSVDKKEAAATVPQTSKSNLVQLIGKTLLLYRPNPEKPKDRRIHLPEI
jgi:RNA-binding protein